jgi:hypothetical protein
VCPLAITARSTSQARPNGRLSPYIFRARPPSRRLDGHQGQAHHAGT